MVRQVRELNRDISDIGAIVQVLESYDKKKGYVAFEIDPRITSEDWDWIEGCLEKMDMALRLCVFYDQSTSRLMETPEFITDKMDQNLSSGVIVYIPTDWYLNEIVVAEIQNSLTPVLAGARRYDSSQYAKCWHKNDELLNLVLATLSSRLQGEFRFMLLS